MAGNDHQYTFYSEGPRGKIKKVVLFNKFPETKQDIYNLAFGDWNERTQMINDLAISNNQDRQKILNTVSSAVIHFTQHYPEASIFATGSTPGRTRLYQMGITAYLDEISLFFDIKGFTEDGWEPFSKGRAYQGFLLKRK